MLARRLAPLARTAARSAARPFFVSRALLHASPRCADEASSENAATNKSARVQNIVDEISQLNVVEVMDLANALKEKFGLEGMSPMMMGGGASAAPAAAPAEAKEEKDAFTVKIDKFDAAQKIKLIKEVRGITNLGLKEAKELVEKAPSSVKADVPKAEAETIKKALEAVGATVSLE